MTIAPPVIAHSKSAFEAISLNMRWKASALTHTRNSLNTLYHLQNRDFKARSILRQSDPPGAGTEHLTQHDKRKSLSDEPRTPLEFEKLDYITFTIHIKTASLTQCSLRANAHAEADIGEIEAKVRFVRQAAACTDNIEPAQRMAAMRAAAAAFQVSAECPLGPDTAGLGCENCCASCKINTYRAQPSLLWSACCSKNCYLDPARSGEVLFHRC